MDRTCSPLDSPIEKEKAARNPWPRRRRATVPSLPTPAPATRATGSGGARPLLTVPRTACTRHRPSAAGAGTRSSSGILAGACFAWSLVPRRHWLMIWQYPSRQQSAAHERQHSPPRFGGQSFPRWNRGSTFPQLWHFQGGRDEDDDDDGVVVVHLAMIEILNKMVT